MTDRVGERRRSIFPINLDQNFVSHPVIGDIIQRVEDFAWTPLDEAAPSSPEFLSPIYQPVASSSNEKPIMCLARIENMVTDLWLHQNARRCSVVVPRELLTSDATTLFDIRLSKNAPIPMAKNILNTLQMLLFLLGDGIDYTWRGKTKHDPLNDPDEKAYHDRLKEIQKMIRENTDRDNRNAKKLTRYNEELKKWKDSMKKKKKKKAQKRKNPEDEDEEEQDEEPDEEMPTPPVAEEAHVIPEAPHPPYAKEEELKTLYSFAGFTLSGGPDEHKFTVQKTGEPYPVSYDRVYLDIEHVFDNAKMEGRHQTTHLMSGEPMAYILHFTVLDPRISILKGLSRLINKNVLIRDERNRKARLRTENVLTSNGSAVQDEDLVVYNAREHSFVNSITSWPQWRDCIAHASSRADLVERKASTLAIISAQETEMSYLDPFSTLNPRTLLAFHSPEHFEFERLVPKNAGSTLQSAAKNFITSTDFDFKNNYTSNMSWVQETEYLLTYKLSEHIIASNCNNVQLPLTTTKLVYRAYKNPYNVVRISGRDLHHMITLDSILPNYMKGITKGNFYSLSTLVNPFPYDADAACEIRTHNETNGERLAKGGADARIASHLTICETIFNRYFETSKTLKPVYQNLAEAGLLDELFRISIRGLANHAPNLPRGLKTIVQYHDDLRPANSYQYSAGGIFPMFKPAFEHYPGLNRFKCPTDKFCDWFSRYYCEGPALSISHLHSLCMFFLFTTPLQFQRTETQSMILVMGPPGNGKTTLLERIFEDNGIPGILRRVDSNSEMAFNTGTNHDGGIQFTDDAGHSDPVFSNTAFGRAKAGGLDQSSQFKTRLTHGELTRQVTQMTQNGARVSMELTTSSKVLFVKLTNFQVMWNCEDAILDRSYVFFAPSSRRIGGFEDRVQEATNTSQSNIAANKRALNIMVTRFQIFSAYVGYFIGCGAMLWTPSIHYWTFYIYWNRFLTVYKEIHGRDIVISSRFSSDRLLAIVYSCVLMRIWVEEGYDETTSTVGLLGNEDKGFSFSVFKNIVEENRMVVRQEDFIRAMSFTDEMAPHRCYTYIVKWLLRYMQKLGYDAVKSNLGEGEYWKEIPNFFLKGVADGFSGTTLEECQSDVNYLDLKLPIGTRDEICTQLAETIYADYQRFFLDFQEVERYLKQHFISPHSDNKAAHGHVTPVYRVVDNEPMIAIPSMPMKIFKYVKVGEKFRLVILRAWVDDWMRDERSYFRNPKYNEEEDFITSPVFATLKHMWNFAGATPGPYILPGMNLGHLNETSTTYDDIRPYEMMSITVAPPDANAARVRVGSSCADSFPEMCTRFTKPNGKPDAYFDPDDPEMTLDKFAALRAKSLKKFL